MAAADERGVEWNDVHLVPHADFFLQQSRGGSRSARHEQFTRVVSRFAMDIDGTRKIRCVAIVVPIVVCEPGVGIRQHDEFAAAGMVQLQFAGRNDGSHTGHVSQQFRDGVDVLWIANVDMCDLMVCDGNGFAFRDQECFTERPHAGAKEAVLPEHTVEMDGAVDSREAVLADHDDFRVDFVCRIDDSPRRCVDFRDTRRILMVESLKVVVEMWEIAQCELWLLFAHDNRGRIGDPVARCDSGAGAPEREKRKRAEFASQVTRCPIQHVKRFAAVAAVMWFGRCAVSGVSGLIEPPEHFGGFVSFVKQFALDQLARLLPEPDFLRVTIEPSVAHDAVVARGEARVHGRLTGRRDRWHGAGPGAGGTDLCQSWCMWQQSRGETDDVKDTNFRQLLNLFGFRGKVLRKLDVSRLFR